MCVYFISFFYGKATCHYGLAKCLHATAIITDSIGLSSCVIVPNFMPTNCSKYIRHVPLSHTHTHSHTHMHTLAHSHAHTHALMHYTNTNVTHTHMHLCTHTHTHTHTHKQTQLHSSNAVGYKRTHSDNNLWGHRSIHQDTPTGRETQYPCSGWFYRNL